MEIKLDYEQWKILKELVEGSTAVEKFSTTGTLELADQVARLEIFGNIKITLPD